MVKLPDFTDLGERIPRASTSQLEMGVNPIPAAMRRLGAAVADLGQVQQANEKKLQADLDRQKDFALNSNFLDFEAQQRQKILAASEKEKDAATGFAKRMNDTYTADARKFFSNVPESHRQEYDLKLKKLGLDVFGDADTFERRAREADAKRRIETGLNNLINRQAGDPNAWKQSLEDGDRLIDASPLPEQLKPELKQKWRRERAEMDIKQHPDDFIAAVGVGSGPEKSGNSSAAALLRRFEGFSSGAYWDVNAYRAGYGSDTITRADGTVENVKSKTKVTRADAERDLARRSAIFAKEAMRQVGGSAWQSLSPNQQAALTSVAYNYGALPSSVVTAVKRGDVEGIAQSVEKLKSHNNGINAKRRQIEADIIRGGGSPAGMITAGNIDLSSRPSVANQAGAAAVIRPFLFEDGGKQILLPATSEDGQSVSEQEAIDLYRKTGKHLGIFKDAEAATAYAESFGSQQEQAISGAAQEPSLADWPERYADIPAEDRPQLVYTFQKNIDSEIAAQEREYRRAVADEARARDEAFKARKADVQLAIETGNVIDDKTILDDDTLRDDHKVELLRRFRTRKKQEEADFRAETVRSGYDLLLDGNLTPEWLTANRKVLTPSQYKNMTGALLRKERDVARQNGPYVDLLKRSASDDDQEDVLDDATEAYKDGVITKTDFNKIYSTSKRTLEEATKRPWLKEIRGSMASQLRPVDHNDAAQYARRLDGLFAFDDWAKANPNETRDVAQKKASELVKEYSVQAASALRSSLEMPYSITVGRYFIRKDNLVIAAQKLKSAYDEGKIDKDTLVREVDILKRWNSVIEEEARHGK